MQLENTQLQDKNNTTIYIDFIGVSSITPTDTLKQEKFSMDNRRQNTLIKQSVVHDSIKTKHSDSVIANIIIHMWHSIIITIKKTTITTHDIDTSLVIHSIYVAEYERTGLCVYIYYHQTHLPL